MKSLLVFAGIIGLYSAPAVAETAGKKTHREPKPVTLVAQKSAAKADAANTDAAKTGAATAGAAKTDAAKLTVADAARATLAAATAAPATPDAAGLALDIPVLPPDTSSVLAPYADLEKRPAPAAAAKPMKPAKAPTMKMGTDFVLGRRQAAAKFERDVEQITPRTLSQAQVATVVQAHMGDIKNCWELVPKAQRAEACTAELELSISDAGVVTDIDLGGDVPAGAHKCMTSAIAKWTFPVAETKTEIEYGISLRSL